LKKIMNSHAKYIRDRKLFSKEKQFNAAS
jgi:hypothetical protein